MEETKAVQRYPDGNIEVAAGRMREHLILVEEEPEGTPKKKVIKQPEQKILKKPATTILKKSATTNLGKAFAKRFAVQLARLARIREEKRANTERIVRALCERSMKNPRQAVGCEWDPRVEEWVPKGLSQERVIVDGGVHID